MLSTMIKLMLLIFVVTFLHVSPVAAAILQFSPQHSHPSMFITQTMPDVNVADKQGNSPLHLAIRNGNLDMFHVLIGTGSDLNAVNKQGDTPLHIAVKLKKLDFIKELIAAGANLNAKNKKLETPLHLAINKNYIAAIKDLIESGADLNVRDKNGSTPLVLGLGGNNKAVNKIIERVLQNNIESVPT